MEVLIAAINIVIGVVCLVLGGDYLVRGASSLARAMRVSSLVIGLTVVAFGTSMPEMAVSTLAAIDNSADVAVGNVVGSNIFNVLFILGVSALVTPLVISSQIIRRELPLMVLAAVMFYVASLDGVIEWWEGAIGISLVILWTVWLVVESRAAEAKGAEAELVRETDLEYGGPAEMSGFKAVLLAFAGLLVLLLGANRTVAGAVSVAEMLGVSQLVIGLTIVAAGTSLPEVVASVMASLKGERDIAAGNIVGSNIFNIWAVMGVAGVCSPKPIPVSDTAMVFDMPVMLGVSFICLPVFFDGTITRWQGGLFVGYYVAYVGYLIMDQSQSEHFPGYCSALGWVIPLTLLSLVISFLSGLRRKVRGRRRE